MKTSSHLAKTETLNAAIKALAVLALALVSLGRSEAQVQVPITNSNFSTSGGEISGQLSLVAGTSTVGPQQLGSSGWYGISNATNLVVVVPVAGFRPGIEVNNDASSLSRGEINYALGANLGGLAGLEMPEANLWQPLIGQSLQANRIYTFSVDLNAGSLLDINALSNRGFGIGVTTGSTTSSVGTYIADSLTSPGQLSISLLSGTTQRLSLTFSTGAVAPVGNIGVSVFAGRGNQTIALNLLTDFTVDDAQLSSVPEPSVALLLGFGLVVALQGHRVARIFAKKQNGKN